MDGLLIALLIILAVADMVLSILCAVIKKKRRCIGRLIINMTDPEKDVYRIDLDDLQDLEKEVIVYLRVEMENDTQK